MAVAQHTTTLGLTVADGEANDAFEACLAAIREDNAREKPSAHPLAAITVIPAADRAV